MLRLRSLPVLSLPHLRIALVALYLAAVLPALMLLHFGLTPDLLVFVMLGAAVVVGQIRLFVRDWGVFLLVLILWQQTGPVAKWAGFPLHMKQLVNADRWLMQPFLHGMVPQVWLQQHLYHAGHWQWYDIVSSLVYALHFPEPLLVGFAIWLRSRALFRRFAAAFLVVAGLGFIVYIVFPAVPPWMASQRYGVISHVVKIFNQFNDAILQQQFGHKYQQVLQVQYNLTAAMPSLHAALPVLSALYLNKTFGRWGLLMLAYAAVVWFAVVYMAEHWVVDVLAGLVLAMVAYAIVEGTVALFNAWRRQVVVQEAADAAPALSAASSQTTQGQGLPARDAG